MKKKLFLSILLVFVISILSGCNKSALEFKEEYESLNGLSNSNGKVHRTITIDENNPFVKISAEELVEKIEEGESLYVYFGDPLCPWCRSVLEKFIEVSNKHNIKKVYYVKIWDEDGNEILRSKYKVNENNELEEVVKGTDAYYKLLSLFGDILSDYNMKDNNGKDIQMNEKRIYAPNFIYVEDGQPKKLVEGISDKQKDAREELTSEMLIDEVSIFEEFFKN